MYTSFILYRLYILSMYRELLRDSLWVLNCPLGVRRMLRGWTESHPICPRTTCWEGPHVICLPTAPQLALCHILKWIQTVEMPLSLSFSPPSLTVSTQEEDKAGMPSNLAKKLWTMTELPISALQQREIKRTWWKENVAEFSRKTSSWSVLFNSCVAFAT